jgi:hypothetical protein
LANTPVNYPTTAETTPAFTADSLPPPPKHSSRTAVLSVTAQMEAQQQLVFSTASRNPAKKLMCEDPHLHTIHPYEFEGAFGSSVAAVQGPVAVAYLNSYISSHGCMLHWTTATYLPG